jgi:HEPN domain-containing protein
MCASIAVYFHCQQAAEKYLKAVLQEQNIVFAKTHDLTALLRLLVPAQQLQIRRFRRGLDFLTQFAVETRYPLKWATKRQAMAALRWAGKVRDACRGILGL